MDIKPINTQYKGYSFRSRLEARWAVFFDALNLNWQYEVEGYDLGVSGWYLPDFVVTSPQGHKYIYEIKPKGSEEGKEKLKILLRHLKLYGDVLSGDPVDVLIDKKEIVIYGDIKGMVQKKYICPRCGLIQDSSSYGCDENYTVTCYPCDFETPSGHGNPLEKSLLFSNIEYEPYKGDIITDRENTIRLWNIIVRAANKARSARFEHLT